MRRDVYKNVIKQAYYLFWQVHILLVIITDLSTISWILGFVSYPAQNQSCKDTWKSDMKWIRNEQDTWQDNVNTVRSKVYNQCSVRLRKHTYQE